MSNKRTNDRDRIEKRRQEAAVRLEARLSRSSSQQFKELNTRLGMNVGALKERTRLIFGNTELN